MLATQQPHQLVLRTVGVLVLVDQQVAIAALILFARLPAGLQQANGLKQQVVEVHRVVLREFFFVDLEDVRNALFQRVGRCQEVLLRIDHVVLGPRNAAQRDAGFQLLVIKAEPLQSLLHNGLLIALVIDGKASRQADTIDAQCPLHRAAECAHTASERC